MADLISLDELTQEYAFFSKGELAWHRKGQVVKEAVEPEEALRMAHLDYTVASTDVFGKVQGKNNEMNYMQSPNHQLIYRTDTNVALGITGNRYTIVQNEEALNFIYGVLKLNPDIKERKDIIIETAGALGNGERIFVTARLPKEFRIGNESKEDEGTELYLVFTNSHDGTTSLQTIVTPVRVVCNNTLSAAMSNNKSIFKFRHTKNITSALQEGASLLNLSYQLFQEKKEMFNAMVGKNISDKTVADIVNRVFLDDSQLRAIQNTVSKNIRDVSPNEISTKTFNKINDVNEWIKRGPGQQFNEGTLYNAYMGINTYLNNGIKYKDYDRKFDALTTGTSIITDRKALEVCANYLFAA